MSWPLKGPFICFCERLQPQPFLPPEDRLLLIMEITKKKKKIRWTFSNILSFLHKKQYQKIVKCIFFGCCNTSLCKYMSACMQMHTAFHRICSLGTYKRTNLCALHYFAIIHLGLISSSLPNPLFSALAHTSTRVQHKAGSIFGW